MTAFMNEVMSFTWDVLKIVIIAKAVWKLCLLLRNKLI